VQFHLHHLQFHKTYSMRNIFTYIGLILILLNSLIGLISSSYSTFNWVTNDVILLLNTVLISLVANSKQKDGFKISFSFLLPVIGLVQLILGSMMMNQFEDNHKLIFIICLFMIQLFFVLLGKVFSKYVD
jgi:ABC-type lipoprotein release transport system permease subunit